MLRHASAGAWDRTRAVTPGVQTVALSTSACFTGLLECKGSHGIPVGSTAVPWHTSSALRANGQPIPPRHEVIRSLNAPRLTDWRPVGRLPGLLCFDKKEGRQHHCWFPAPKANAQWFARLPAYPCCRGSLWRPNEPPSDYHWISSAQGLPTCSTSIRSPQNHSA